MTRDDFFFGAILVYFIIAICFAWYRGYDKTEQLKTEAIEQGYAMYDKETGEWRWK